LKMRASSKERPFKLQTSTHFVWAAKLHLHVGCCLPCTPAPSTHVVNPE
jgi:hypothetical protein